MFSSTFSHFIVTVALLGTVTASAVPVLNMKRDPQGAPGTCGIWSTSTVLKGNGDPHTDVRNAQSVVDCGDGECNVGSTESQSYTITASIGGAAQWIDGGFDVSYTVETGESRECDATAGERVCIWKRVPHTAYTVQNQDYNQCTGSGDPYGSFITESPINNAGEFQCRRNDDCKLQGDEYWEYNVVSSLHSCTVGYGHLSLSTKVRARESDFVALAEAPRQTPVEACEPQELQPQSQSEI